MILLSKENVALMNILIKLMQEKQIILKKMISNECLNLQIYRKVSI
jgi:hypothetical protein